MLLSTLLLQVAAQEHQEAHRAVAGAVALQLVQTFWLTLQRPIQLRWEQVAQLVVAPATTLF
jgi:hypothetical protein